jgi:TonB family protein
MLLANYKNSHFLALSAAAFLHGALGFWAVMPSNPVVINKQSIQVSFVAPNSVNQKSENSSQKKMALNNESKNALFKKAEKNPESEKQKQQLASGKNTSGLVDPNATATNSAQVDPVFDAAYLNNPSPSYPMEAKRRNIQGKVLVKVLVKTDGNPEAVDIARSSGNSSLDEAAIDAVRNWHFVPARQGNKSVQANVIVPVEFKII